MEEKEGDGRQGEEKDGERGEGRREGKWMMERGEGGEWGTGEGRERVRKTGGGATADHIRAVSDPKISNLFLFTGPNRFILTIRNQHTSHHVIHVIYQSKAVSNFTRPTHPDSHPRHPPGGGSALNHNTTRR